MLYIIWQYSMQLDSGCTTQEIWENSEVMKEESRILAKLFRERVLASFKNESRRVLTGLKR